MSSRPARKVYGALRRMLAEGRAAVEADHERRLRLTIAHARHVPFYKERLAALPERFTEDDFQRLPELARGDLAAHLEALLNPHSPEPPLLSATGGSTGAPTPFYLTVGHKTVSAACDNLSESWVGGGYGKRTVVLWGASVDAPPRPSLAAKLRFALQGGLRIIDCFRTDPETLEAARRIIELYRPQVVRGYRSILLEFAHHLEATRPLRHRPAAVLSASEVLLPEHRVEISAALGAPVFDRYGSRECGMMAAESRDQRMYVMLPNSHLEVVSEAGVNVPGEPGRLLVTTLNNPAMPLLRYAIGDGAIWDGYVPQASLPLPIIRMTYGRDVGVVPLGNGASIYLLFFHHNLSPYHQIRSWQLIRTTPSALELHLLLRAPLPEPVRAEIERRFDAYVGPGQTFTVRVVDALAKNRTGKVELFVDRAKP